MTCVSKTPGSSSFNSTKTMGSPSLRRISVANLLLFASAYMLFPALALQMAEQLDLTLTQAGMVFMAMLGGRLLAGPFINYLVDAFRRKYLCTVATVIFPGTSVFYPLITDLNSLYLLALIQGMALCVSGASIITLCIDLAPSECRNQVNMKFGMMTRTGMLLGAAVGSALHLNLGFKVTLAVALIMAVVGIFFLFITHVPFRAPIGNRLLSIDRFLLPQGWAAAINLALVGIAAGVLLPLVHFETTHTLMWEAVVLPYYVFVLPGYVAGSLLNKHVFAHHEGKTQMLTGLSTLLVGIIVFLLWQTAASAIASALLLGAALKLITPMFLRMLINLAHHCERASANSTNLQAWTAGLSLGIMLSCHLKDDYSSAMAYQTALFAATAALIWFIAVAHPYYTRNKVR